MVSVIPNCWYGSFLLYKMNLTSLLSRDKWKFQNTHQYLVAKSSYQVYWFLLNAVLVQDVTGISIDTIYASWTYRWREDNDLGYHYNSITGVAQFTEPKRPKAMVRKHRESLANLHIIAKTTINCPICITYHKVRTVKVMQFSDSEENILFSLENMFSNEWF